MLRAQGSRLKANNEKVRKREAAEFGFRNAEFGREGEIREQGGRIGTVPVYCLLCSNNAI